MNRKIGFYAAVVNAGMVTAFAISMLVGWLFGCYLSSLLIAVSFVPMAAALASEAEPERRVSAAAAMIFAGMYALCNAIVYFTQLTAVRQGNLNETTAALLDFQQFGLFFSYDLLGYGLMALSTFFLGLSMRAEGRSGRWLKGMLMAHGIFAPACFIFPILGLFHPGMTSGEWIGTLLLEFWCAWFIPVGVLCCCHFRGNCAVERPR